MSAMTVEDRPIIKLQLYMQFLRKVNSWFYMTDYIFFI